MQGARYVVGGVLAVVVEVACWFTFRPSQPSRFEYGPHCIPASVQDC